MLRHYCEQFRDSFWPQGGPFLIHGHPKFVELSFTVDRLVLWSSTWGHGQPLLVTVDRSFFKVECMFCLIAFKLLPHMFFVFRLSFSHLLWCSLSRTHLSIYIYICISVALFPLMPIKRKACKPSTASVGLVLHRDRMYPMSDAKPKFEDICKVSAVHGRSVQRTPDSLRYFSLLVNFDWEPFLFISEDIYELPIYLFYANLSSP